MTKIFISHSTKDTEFARRIAQALIEVGISVWIDVADIPAGMKWSTAIQNGLNECDAMIVILSPDAMASNNVEDEWQYYLDKGKKLFPVRWQPADVHFQLNRIQYIDFHEQNFPAAFVKLCAEFQRQGFAIGDSRGQMNVIRSDNGQKTSPTSSIISGIEDILPPPFAWCEIPAGEVTLAEGGYLKQPTAFRIPTRRIIAKYPVTNAQYAKFIEAGGYTEKRWWTKAGWQGKEQKKWTEPGFWQQKEFKGANYPVVGVSWYEAVAFCQWLSEVSGETIKLPTEQQWQRAAQGDDGRTYPWGNEFDKNRCNVEESGIGHTTPVTQYPQGASPYGVLDLSGNAWEWCRIAYESGSQEIDGADARVIRGGSFNHTQEFAICSFRSNDFPSARAYFYGFRIILSL